MKVFQAVKALIRSPDDGKILFLKEKTPSGRVYYSLPGGRLEEGEGEEQALKREVREETGLEIAIGRELGKYSFSMENGSRVDATVFECNCSKLDSLLKPGAGGMAVAGEDIVSFHWFLPSEFLSKGLPVTDESFNVLLEGISRR